MTTENPPKRAADLSPEKLSLLVMRMKKKAAETRDAGRIPRRAGGEAPALSFAQQRLWLLDRLEPGNSAYNMPFPARLLGTLDVAVLARTISEIVRRHEALRTTFVTVDGVPAQVVAPFARVALPVADLASLPAARKEEEGRRLVAEETKTPFELESGPLLRTSLVRLSAAEHLLLLDMHHIVSDGWSIGIFFNELSSLYEAFLTGQPSPLPELSIQYADYAAWQREWLSGAVLEEQVDYWRHQLAGSPPALELPTDRMRPAIQTHRGAASKTVLPADLTLALRELSRREGASMFMLLLTGFNLLLSRLAGQDEVVVGSPSAGRRRMETEGLIGLFLNTLVLRTGLAGDPTFRELLGRVKTVVLGAYRYQEVPFEKLLEELQPERQLSRSPFFQVLFNMVSVPEGRLEMPGLRIESLAIPEPDSKFDFTFYLQEAGDSVHVNVVYNADLFDAVRIDELMRQFEYVLAQGVANPDERIGAFSLVTTSAAAVLPDPALPLGDEWRGAVHHGLSRNAEQWPERTAVVGWREGEAWCYGELEARSNQLAHFLRSKGLETGDVVAVWAHRGASLVWAVYGALKAGGTFMILDPAYPASRLVDYLRIGRPKAWLAVDGAPAPPREVEDVLLGLSCDVRLSLPPLGQSAMEGVLAGHPTADPEIAVGPDDAAVLTFTSGSTGRPKGVIGRHGPLSHFYPWMGRRFGLSEIDRFGMLSALSHDPLQRDLFTPIWFGAALVVPEPDRIGTHGYLAGWVRRAGISVLHLTPAMMEMVTISAEDRPEGEREMPSLRLAFVVGDQLKKSDVERLQRLAASLSCVNLYGSTETQRSVSFFPVPRPESPEWAEIGREVLPLGQGMDDVQVLILNGAKRLAGVGEAGEIYIRSHHLARGYLGDAALSAERFLTNPFAQAGPGAGDRVYKTGDLGRYLPDGTAEFAGRVDFQVKIRGFRIELGEVEAALARFPGVKECVVLVREDRPGDRRLAAYLVAETAPPARDLHSFLVQRLPEYMVPSAFVTLPALPLTQTGKVDRRALPVPEAEGMGEAAARELSPVEELLLGIWADLLGRDRVGANDNFFELGGHSLLATRMLSRVRGSFGVDLPLRALFEEPTVEGLAASVERAQRDAAGLQAPPIVPVPREGAIPLSFAQKRLWFLDQLEPGSFAYNIAGGVRLTGTLDVPALSRTLSEIVRRHESLRTTFATVEGEPVAVIAPPSPFELPVHDLSGLPEEERERTALALATGEVQRPFDLARGPLLRLTLLKLTPTEHAMVVAMHHVISDGWSIGLLVRELGILYGAFVSGRPSPLPELPVQYADFAAWQRRWLQGEVLEAQLRFWADHLAGAPPVLELPTDRPRPAVQTHRGGQIFLEMGAELSERLEAAGRRLGVTPFMTLLGAFAVLLSRYSGQSDIVTGSPIANRNHEEIEDLIGFFANTLVLRTNLGSLGGDPLFSELARKVRETALGAYAHQDLPFEKLVDELHPERDLSHSPVFQVMFVLQNAPSHGLELPGLTLGALPIESGRAQFDIGLTLAAGEHGLVSRIDYNLDLFDAATADRMIHHYRHLLGGVAADPERRVSALPLLSEVERYELLVGGNDTRAQVPGRTIHELFEATAARVPGAVAVSFEGASLTYGDLNARANRLAHHLRGLGVRPGVLAGLCVERSLGMLVGLLGVLKAGGAYVPLDPSYPADRIAYVLEDGRIPVLLTQAALLTSVPELAALDARIVELDRFDEGTGFAGESQGNPAPLAGPDDLAYVIYTSGSTGKPKGVEVRHLGVANFLASMAREPGLSERDVMVAVTTISFDIAVLELYLPLSLGARVELVSREVAVDGARLAALIASSGATAMQATPATWRVLLEADWEGAPGLKVLCGGEALPPDLARELLARVESLWNVYGPTETTVWSAVHPVEAGGDGRRPVPIGRPIANTVVYLLDRSLEPVPPGAAGELYIGGLGVARGYLRRPDLTAERFVPDPFSGLRGEPGARLYRTGDLARFLSGSVLDFLGRADHQVKVRGFRIELGEIEAVLAEHPAVQECAVVVREDVPGTKRLAAYYVAEGEAPSVADLRTTLLAKLPDYMVPQVFAALPALPLTPNGKVDRRALTQKPAPEGEGSAERRERVAPRNPVEEILAEIWAGVLRIPEVSIHDNFFELGGDSILTIQVVSRAKKQGLRLVPRQIFQHQTIAALALVADASELAAESASATGPVPLTPGQRLLGKAPENWNDALLVELPAGVGAEALERALSEAVSRHETLRLRFERGEDGAWTQRIAGPDEVTPLPLGKIAAADVPAARERFDLAAGPFSAFLVGQDRLLLLAHPLAVDASSWPLLLEDLAAACGGQTPPAASASFRRWAEAVAERSRGLAGNTGLADWLSDVRLGTGTGRLPVDLRGDAPNTEGTARTISVTLPAAETRALLADATRRYGNSVEEVLVAALTSAIAGWTGAQRVAVELEGSPREAVLEGLDGSRTVGPLSWVYPLFLENETSEGELLKGVKETVRRTPSRGLDYALLRAAGGLERLPLLPEPGLALRWLQPEAASGWRAEALPAWRGTDAVRRHVLAVEAGLAGESLRVDWTYSEALHRPETVKRLADRFLESLRSLVRHCQSAEAGGFTPSDFPEAGLSQDDLDDLLADLS